MFNNVKQIILTIFLGLSLVSGNVSSETSSKIEIYTKDSTIQPIYLKVRYGFLSTNVLDVIMKNMLNGERYADYGEYPLENYSDGNSFTTEYTYGIGDFSLAYAAHDIVSFILKPSDSKEPKYTVVILYNKDTNTYRDLPVNKVVHNSNFYDFTEEKREAYKGITIPDSNFKLSRTVNYALLSPKGL